MGSSISRLLRLRWTRSTTKLFTRERKGAGCLRMFALELQRLSTPVLAGCCGLIAGGMLVMAASNLSPVIAGLAMCGLLVAVAIMFSPSLGLLLTAAVIPIERLGRLTAD